MSSTSKERKKAPSKQGSLVKGGAEGNKPRLWFMPRQGLTKNATGTGSAPSSTFLGILHHLCPAAPCTLTPTVSTRVMLARSPPRAAGISLRAQVRQKLPRNLHPSGARLK